jgi:hypothetical protein
MRPAQNKQRMRGRPNNNRKGPNPLTRSYESSGPDVKIRGTAHHVSEKYLQLARDAQASGDPVMAESYLQHAEHYFRLIAAAQQAQQQASGLYPRVPGEPLAEDADDDSDFSGIPDRFASPPERLFPPAGQPNVAAQPQPGPAQPNVDRPYQESGDRQGGDRQGMDRPERAPRPERQFQDRNYRDRERQPYPDKPYQDQRPYQEQRPYQDRNGRGRDQENRGNRGRGPRDYRSEGSIRVDPRDEPRMAEPAIESNGLPAFITAPVRVPAESHDIVPAIDTVSPLVSGAPDEEGVANGFHPRPRRRRRGKAEMGIDGAQGGSEGSANESIQD